MQSLAVIHFHLTMYRSSKSALNILGTGETVKNFKYLQKIGVTHVLNTAENDVNINPQRFKDVGISYKGFR